MRKPANSVERQQRPLDPWIERIAWLMDNSIPIGPWTIGLDGIIGLVPGLGDLAGAAVSVVIILRAVAAGAPRVAIARMVANVALDALAGAVPFAGDFFDMAFKANARNARIYREFASGHPDTLRHWGFFALLALALLAILAVPGIVLLLLLREISR